MRYNVDAGPSPWKWRVIVDGVEHLATDVLIRVPSWTTEAPTAQGSKYHIAADGHATFTQTGAIVVE